MITNLFEGTEEDRKIFVCLDKIEFAQLDEYKGYNLKFVSKEKLEGEIKRWSPFFASGIGYKRQKYTVTFKCPVCGCTSCERENIHFADPFFWQKNYKCKECGANGFYYASDAFTITEEKGIQLDLFDKEDNDEEYDNSEDNK